MTISTSPTTQDALSMIVQQYNHGKASELQIDDIEYVFEVPQVNINASFPVNTLIRANPASGNTTGYSRNIYYNRIDLSQIQDGPWVVKGAAITVSELVPAINDFFGINLVANDYYNDNIAQEEGPWFLRSKPGSLMFIGNLLLQLSNGTPISVGEELPPTGGIIDPGLGLTWEVGSNINETWAPNMTPTIRVSGVSTLANVTWVMDWTPGQDGSYGAPEFDPGYTSDSIGGAMGMEDRIYTLRLHIGPIETPLTIASGVQVIHLWINGVDTGKSLVIVIQDEDNYAPDGGFYEGVGTYLTLAEAGLE